METTAVEVGKEERLKHSDLQWEYAQTGSHLCEHNPQHLSGLHKESQQKVYTFN